MSGILEILIIVVIVLIVFGASKLPALGDSLGRLVRNFKAASSSRDDIEVSAVQDPKALEGEESESSSRE